MMSPLTATQFASTAAEPQRAPYLPLPAERKRVAVIAHAAGALIGSCHGLILDMINRGHRVFAMAPGLSNKDMRILSHIGAEAYNIPERVAFWDKYSRMRELSTILSDLDPSVALIESARNGAISIAAAKIAHVPHVVATVPSLGPAFMEGASSSSWGGRQAMKAVYRTIFNWSDSVIFHNTHDRKLAAALGLIDKNKRQLTVGGWGEDLVRNVQRPLPPLDRGILFIMAAPLDRFQGVMEYCEAAQALRLKARKARFYLASLPGEIGSPIPVDELKRYRQFVQYIGPVEDVGSVISRCHVVTAPSYGHGTPHALSRGLAAGRPIITTETRSCRDFVQNGVNGYRVLPKNAEALTRAMTQILQRPDLIPLMAEESRRQALRFYDVNTVNAVVLETLGL